MYGESFRECGHMLQWQSSAVTATLTFDLRLPNPAACSSHSWRNPPQRVPDISGVTSLIWGHMNMTFDLWPPKSNKVISSVFFSVWKPNEQTFFIHCSVSICWLNIRHWTETLRTQCAASSPRGRQPAATVFSRCMCSAVHIEQDVWLPGSSLHFLP